MKTLLKIAKNLGLATVTALALPSCATSDAGFDDEDVMPRKPPRGAIKVGEQMVQTSYDYSRPTSVAPDSKPVWILPVITSGWKPARVDSRSGDWIGGHYAATVVEEGKWATLEEAELSGKPYILPGETRPVIPTPLKNQSASSTGEINATTLEQKLARLDRLERESREQPSTPSTGRGPSSTSISNQTAIPTLPPPSSRPSSTPTSDSPSPPSMRIPGLTQPPASTPSESAPRPPEILPTPPTMLPPLPPPPTVGPGGTIIDQSQGPSPSPASSASSESSPRVLISPTPAPIYEEETGQIILSYAPPGSTTSVQTPKGKVSVTYGDNGETTVTLGGKTKTVTLKNPQDKLKITIPN